MTRTTPFEPIAGQPCVLENDLTLVLAPNPSPMTYLGTNTFILGDETVAIIDPGPDHPKHLAALRAAIGTRTVSHILVTHSHLDHSPLARPLADATGALIYAFGDSSSGRSAVMQSLSNAGLTGGGEGIDPDFTPDHRLIDGQVVTGKWGTITAIHTPGHIGNHLCFQWNNAIFTGDHVMDWASSLVSPPDGDLTDFMASCAKLQTYDAQVFYPAHGAPVTAPQARLAWLINHRLAREAQILAALQTGEATPEGLTEMVYLDTPAALRGAAQRNVFAHLIDLYQRGKVTAKGHLSPTAIFRLAGVA
jgi:glyoxylase-like metal-dependent hydrolase (beta-lactamase superfamily II)